MKAQVTLFMIIGLAILLAFAVVMYMVSFKSLKQAYPEIPEQQFRKMNVDSVNAYVTDCVASSAAEALELLGKQGGRLYKSQGSIIDDPDEFISHEGIKISYSILPPAGDVGSYTSDIPSYPWKGFPWIMKDNQETKWFYGYFGLPNFPPLYDFSPDSIQEMLETYIENKLPICFDESIFKGMSFELGKPNAKMIIAKDISQLYTEEFISFDVDWPIKITDLKGAKTELRNFAVNYPISFGKIYYNAKSLIDSDVSNILFNPKEQLGYEVSVIKEANKDIVIFTDRKSILIGKPFSFYIARKNRPPALEEISDEVSKTDFCIGTKFSIQDNRLLASGNQLNYELTAYDPDEDVITFHLAPLAPKLMSSSMSFRVIARDSRNSEDYQEIRVFGRICG